MNNTAPTQYELRIELVTGVTPTEQREMSTDDLFALIDGKNFGRRLDSTYVAR